MSNKHKKRDKGKKKPIKGLIDGKPLRERGPKIKLDFITEVPEHSRYPHRRLNDSGGVDSMEDIGLLLSHKDKCCVCGRIMENREMEWKAGLHFCNNCFEEFKERYG